MSKWNKDDARPSSQAAELEKVVAQPSPKDESQVSNQNAVPQQTPAPAKEQTLEEKIVAAVATAIPAAMMAMETIRHKNQKDDEAERIRVANRLLDRCPECRQVKGAGGCNGKHKQIVLYPVNLPEDMAREFEGCWVSGQHYRSMHAGDKITVPEQSTMEYDLEVWTRTRWQLMTGKKTTVRAGVATPAGIQASTVGIGNGFVA